MSLSRSAPASKVRGRLPKGHAATFRYLGWDHMDTPADACSLHVVTVEFGESASKKGFKRRLQLRRWPAREGQGGHDPSRQARSALTPGAREVATVVHPKLPLVAWLHHSFPPHSLRFQYSGELLQWLQRIPPATQG